MENISNYNQVIRNKIKNSFKGDRKYFTIVFFIISAILLIGFLTPSIVSNKESNWQNDLSKKVDGIKSETFEIFHNKQTYFLQNFNELKERLKELIKNSKVDYSSITVLINSNDYPFDDIALFNYEKKLVCWKDNSFITEEEFNKINYQYGETFFYKNDLAVYLTISDTINVAGNNFYLLSNQIIEKYFSLNDDNLLSLTEQLSEKFKTDFSISYNPYKAKTKDGRKYSFEILSNKNNKIGLVTIEKPSPAVFINLLREKIANIQSFLILVGIIFLGLSIRSDYKDVKSRLLKYFLFILFLVILRIILFKLGLLSYLFEGELTNPNYFSSTFSYGIVKSPLEFFISILFFLIIAIRSFQEVNNLIRVQLIKTDKKVFIAALIILTIITFMLIRGYAAAMKSVIFDSTLRYFNEVDIIPHTIHIFINFCILCFGTGILLLILALWNFLIQKILKSNFFNYNRQIVYPSFILLLLISSVVFIIIQKQPLISIQLMILTILLIALLVYLLIKSSKTNWYIYVYTAIVSSIISVSYLNHFNAELERESLKTVAIEYNRPTENLLNFLVNESLISASSSSELIEAFYNPGSNYNATAFILWNKSALKNEAGQSAITILDRQRKPLGSFSMGIEEKYRLPQILQVYSQKEIKVFDLSEKENPEKIIIAGIVPIEDNNLLLGYVATSLVLEKNSIYRSRPFRLLNSKKELINNLIDISNLNVFVLNNSKLFSVTGEFQPSDEHLQKIINADYINNEAWINLSFNNENHLAYLYKSKSTGGTKIISVTLKEREIQWSFYNFFKLFIIHTVFIFFLFITLVLIYFKDFKEIWMSFRFKLLYSFLVISIIPIISLAIFNRKNVNDKSLQLTKNALLEKSQLIEKYFYAQKNSIKDENIFGVAAKTEKELDIAFSIYSLNSLIFTTNKDLYNSGLFSRLLPSTVYMNLNSKRLNSYFFTNNIDNVRINYYFKTISFNNEKYVIAVNDLFNSITTTLSPIEVDVFLFGIYSFAILLIILVSTILANSISSPLRRLTNATRSIALGDLNVPLELNEKGEIKDLVTSFSFMKKMLKKNQEELAQLERENAWKEMAKQVAHEIKNPLTPMKLTLQQLIAAYNDKAKNFDVLFDKVSSTILHQIDILNQIASEFSRFARMPHIQLTQFDFIPILYEVKTLFNEEGIEIKIKTEKTFANIEADHSQFRRMLINFIRNSIQANSTEIIISVSLSNEQYVIHIIDNGNGIPVEYQNKIFDSNFSTKSGGMGIGLKLTKRFIENINGIITLESSSDKGTVFKIVIPSVQIEK